MTEDTGSAIMNALRIDAAGLRGWQWMFLLEGIPAVLLGCMVLMSLCDRPGKATWLAADERQWLESELARERATLAGSHGPTLATTLRDSRVWLLGLIYFGMVVGLYAFGFWLPQIVKGLSDLSNFEVGLVTAVPYGVAALAMYFWGRHSDATGERTWHVAAAAFVGAAGLAISAQLDVSPVLGIMALSVSAIGIYAALPVFWTLPTAMLTGSAAAAGIALINSIGNIGGFLGPTLVGYVKDASGSYAASLWTLAAFITMSGIAVLAHSGRRGQVLHSSSRPGCT